MLKKILIGLSLVMSHTCWAIDIYDAATGQLTIPIVDVNGVNYKNVVVTIKDVVSLKGGEPLSDSDSYDSSSNLLTIPTVQVGSTSYTNVSVKIDSILSVNNTFNSMANQRIFSLKNNFEPWFSGYFSDKSGNEYLILSTMDEYNAHSFTDPTPIYIFKVDSYNSIVDIAPSIFEKVPNFYWVRNVITFTHPETNSQAIWFCNQGREVGDNLQWPHLEGRWGEQDALFVKDIKTGKYLDYSKTLPQQIDFSHGCDAIATDKDLILLKNILGPTPNFIQQQQALRLSKSKWESIYQSQLDGFYKPDSTGFKNGSNPFWVTGGKLRNGEYFYLFGDGLVINSSEKTYFSKLLDYPELKEIGYSYIQGSVVGDLNNDGLDDLVLIFSSDGVKLKPFLNGAKIGIFFNNGKGDFIFNPKSIINSYQIDDFSLNPKLIDINFDGYLDIVFSGSKYADNNKNFQQWSIERTEKVLINNKNNSFSVKTINDSEINSLCMGICQYGIWFLKQQNGYSILVYTKESSNRYSKKGIYAKQYVRNSPIPLK